MPLADNWLQGCYLIYHQLDFLSTGETVTLGVITLSHNFILLAHIDFSLAVIGAFAVVDGALGSFIPTDFIDDGEQDIGLAELFLDFLVE